MTDELGFPTIENAPGLVWKPRLAGWEARWQARTDLVRRGYLPKSARLWKGREPTELEKEFIRSRCQAMQDEMLTWGRGGHVIAETAFTGTVRSLINCYETDPDSGFQKIRYKTRETYMWLMRRIMRDCGDMSLEDLKARDFLRLYESWIKPEKEGGAQKIALGHSLIGMFRTMASFGATILESQECERIANMFSRMKFKMSKPRREQITAEQAVAVRAMLHTMGLPSMALAQAIQFDCTFRQKDAIGEWVPISEPGVSDVIAGNEKWLRGVRWEEIDKNFTLTHVTSKKQKEVVLDLRLAPMVLDELHHFANMPAGALLNRDMFPAAGPVVVSEITMIPWTNYEFRRQWRKAAEACGIPKEVFNMDSRAGAITEALVATGGDLDSVRISATHSNSATTIGYSRGDAGRIADVMTKRGAHRNKPGTSET